MKSGSSPSAKPRAMKQKSTPPPSRTDWARLASDEVAATPSGEHPEAHVASWAGLMQADAYAGYDRLYAAGRRPEPVGVERVRCAHALHG